MVLSVVRMLRHNQTRAGPRAPTSTTLHAQDRRALKGLPEAITATWPQAKVQTCVVHLVRNTLRYASKAHWAKITRELKVVFTAPTVASAETAFAEFAETWRDKYPAMIGMWERSWT